MKTKVCSKCREPKLHSEFTIRRYKSGRVGLKPRCNDCRHADRTNYRNLNLKDNDRSKAYNKIHAEEIRGKKLVKNYWPTLTWQEAIMAWEDIFNAQDGKCALGHEAKILHVDHCHATGKIRGLLCYNCNNGIGRFKDSVEILENAILYLKKMQSE